MREDIVKKLVSEILLSQDPRQTLIKQAHRAVNDHVAEGMPLPSVGDRVRCVHFQGQKSFQSDVIDFKVGNVYDVLAVGAAALDREIYRVHGDEAPEDVKTSYGNITKHMEEHPEKVGTVLYICDPDTGLAQSIMYPSTPCEFFVLVEKDAANIAQETDLPEGTVAVFTDLTIVAKKGSDIQLQTPYTFTNRRSACECANPECAGKNVILYDFKVGENQYTAPFPSNIFGTADVFPVGMQ